MHFVTLNDDGRERTGRTDIFTSTTADADLLIDGRYPWRLVVILVQLYHFDGTRRTVAGTVAAVHTVAHRHTVLLNPHGVAYLH